MLETQGDGKCVVAQQGRVGVRLRVRLPGLMVLLCGVLWTACTTGPSAGDLQRADIGEQPEQAVCEAVAREYLLASGRLADGARIRFSPLRHGYYRVSMLSSAKFGWVLAAEVEQDASRPAPTPVQWDLYFLHDQIVAVGSMQPHRNRTTSSGMWVVVEYGGGGLTQEFAGL